MKDEQMRPYERDMSPVELRAHMIADHRMMSTRLGGDDWHDDVLNESDPTRLHALHTVDHAEINYQDIPAFSLRVGHWHLPRVVRLPQDTRAQWPILSITTTGEGWEFLYTFIGDMVARGLAVRLNSSPEPVELFRLVGDVHSNEGPVPFILAHPWNSLTEREYGPDEIAIPLFNDDGSCHIWQVEIL